ncbi:hypothetical protein CFC21_086598 [Triticum aestivum]|uniref:Protein kinase domain-containing protein n=2 Tax=Triticum aestivum TaxID=4565 RepID=A0A9R1IGC3_WHEAT|nr:uncharacterized protein LOC123135806 [Triticum aestivum]XP_044410952.1 uncharacterized protein LOC123135806 [Triticum aestivum]XP_044410953.1 uncharacterized protein LOC123135806 [Triticum aestivum]XP_044410954.1 uncharacterized protein LOC123135806 [Triticum aestivum]KAF7082741.1 hypothetical protein CFC21_086598 [Triticum aestivum]
MDTSTTTREFTLEFLEQITDNFSEKHVIGRGGYGVVYKGVLENGEEIALKKLHHVSGLDDTQFMNEFNHLMRAQHPNITRLVGYCYYTGHQRIKFNGDYVFSFVDERVLCFEYLEGGSLDKHISDESCGLDWHTCFNIIKGVCEGLNYLHNGSNVPIYHLDLKPANILLDKNMVPKIGDFGLSRLFPSTQTHVTIKIIGTPGYMPPEYIERHEITSKYDVFSLGVIIVRMMAGDEGYSRYAHMSLQEFLEHVYEKWEKRLQEKLPSRISEQITTCIELALRCLEVRREERPTIAEIVDELNKVDTGESSHTGQDCQVARNQNTNSERRGRIVFYTTNRPPVPFDMFSCGFSSSPIDDELHLTDGVSCNYNGCPVPPAALKALFKRPKLADVGGVIDADIDAGHVSGLVFVSERDDGLETLYIAIRFSADSKVKVFSLADIFGAADFSGVRLEDSGCFGGGYSVGSRTVDHCLIYISTKEPVQQGRSPWTVVYKTNLATGKTERLTPQGVFDLSPAVSPSGKAVAVASFEGKSWNGDVEKLNVNTNIYVMNVGSEECEGLGRKLLIENGGWPSWGSNDIIFFHRRTNITGISLRSTAETYWGVFRHNISTKVTIQVTPEELDAVTPAAISETKVAVATIRKKTMRSDGSVEAPYRHIEIFDTNAPGLPPIQITQKTNPESHHYNPFVLDGGLRIGYHRCRLLQHGYGDQIASNLHRLQSPVRDVGLFRACGLFPSISEDGSKLAFVDSEFKKVSVVDSKGLRIVCMARGTNRVFSPVWNQNPDKDVLYFCIGHSLSSDEALEIYSISNASGEPEQQQVQRLTYGGFNNASLSSSPDGNKFVFQSTRDFCKDNSLSTRDFFPTKKDPTYGSDPSFGEESSWQPSQRRKKEKNSHQDQEEIDGTKEYHKNLYIMLNSDVQPGLRSEEGWVMRLTRGPWTDTHCQWSPKGDWIVFSSSRGRELDSSLDQGHYSLYLVKPSDPTVVIRVMGSGAHLGGHLNHPVFSPDGRSIAVTAGPATVSVEPISLPQFTHGLRSHSGDIFVVDINDPDSKKQKEDVIKGFRRITHSRYECGTPAWTRILAAATEPNVEWLSYVRAATEPNVESNMLLDMDKQWRECWRKLQELEELILYNGHFVP